MTQVPWSGATPRSPAMAGIETFAIEVSSTFMNVASDRTTVPSASAVPWSGAGCAASGFAILAMVNRIAARYSVGRCVAAASRGRVKPASWRSEAALGDAGVFALRSGPPSLAAIMVLTRSSAIESSEPKTSVA